MEMKPSGTVRPLSRAKTQMQPVRVVKTDHQITMRTSTRREPQRSPIQPPGTSKMV